MRRLLKDSIPSQYRLPLKRSGREPRHSYNLGMKRASRPFPPVRIPQVRSPPTDRWPNPQRIARKLRRYPPWKVPDAYPLPRTFLVANSHQPPIPPTEKVLMNCLRVQILVQKSKKHRLSSINGQYLSQISPVADYQI